MSIGYQIEHEQRKDEAVQSCIKIFQNFHISHVEDLPKSVQEAWEIGRKLKLGVNE